MNKIITATILLIVFITCARAELKPVTDGPLTLFYEQESNTKIAEDIYRHVWQVSVNKEDDRVVRIYNVTCNGKSISDTGIKLGKTGFYEYYSFSTVDAKPIGDWVYDVEVEGPTGE
jgi:hypothetical protein